jgi:hypothetical protein
LIEKFLNTLLMFMVLFVERRDPFTHAQSPLGMCVAITASIFEARIHQRRFDDRGGTSIRCSAPALAQALTRRCETATPVLS